MSGQDNPIANLVAAAAQSSARRPPVADWNPPLNGVIDITIDRDGQWFHEGSPFTRESLVKLFSSLLKREGDDYFLVTPVEKWQINVAVAPFVVIDARLERCQGSQAVIFTTRCGEELAAGGEHPVDVQYDGHGSPLPLVTVRDNLAALISRPVFYQLVEWAEPDCIDGRELMMLDSGGQRYVLGEL